MQPARVMPLDYHRRHNLHRITCLLTSRSPIVYFFRCGPTQVDRLPQQTACSEQALQAQQPVSIPVQIKAEPTASNPPSFSTPSRDSTMAMRRDTLDSVMEGDRPRNESTASRRPIAVVPSTPWLPRRCRYTHAQRVVTTRVELCRSTIKPSRRIRAAQLQRSNVMRDNTYNHMCSSVCSMYNGVCK